MRRTNSWIALGLLLGALAPARAATPLFVGNETIDTSAIVGSISTTTSAGSPGVFRTNMVSSSLAPSGGGSTSDPPSSYAQVTFNGASSQFWTHFQLGSTATATVSNAQFFRLLDGATARIAVRGTGTAGQLKISTRNAAGTFTDLSGATTAAGVWTCTTCTVAVDLFIHYAVAGQVTLYMAGVPVASFTGDVTTDSATTLSGAQFADYQTANSQNFSEILVSATDTRGRAVWRINPQAAGTTQDCTPSTVGNVSKTNANDTSSIATDTASKICSFTVPTTAPNGIWLVDAIVQTARVQVSTTGPQTFTWFLRTAGSNFTSGSVSPTTSFSNFNNQIWSLNPNCSCAWLLSDITGGTMNLGIETQP